MKILITNHHLQEFTGSEVSTAILAKYLHKKGHTPIVYAKYTQPLLTKRLEDMGVQVVNSLELVKDIHFDIAHIQHNICAYEVRYFYPKIPMIMWIHGVIPFLELPPIINLNISTFLVNNKEGKDHIIRHGVDEKDIIIFRNIIDREIFFPTSHIDVVPKRALVLSNKISEEKEKKLKQVLTKLGIEYKFIGQRFGQVSHEEIPRYINDADIVFTVALGAMETMFCGRIPILYDNNYAPYDDGIVTPNRFDALMECNFSGRATKQQLSEQELMKEIHQYRKEYGEDLRKKAIEIYDADKQVDKIITIYKDVIQEYRHESLRREESHFIEHIVNIIQITKHYSYFNTITTCKSVIKRLEEDLSSYKQSLENIQSSKTYKIWQRYTGIKKKIVKVVNNILHAQ